MQNQFSRSELLIGKEGIENSTNQEWQSLVQAESAVILLMHLSAAEFKQQLKDKKGDYILGSKAGDYLKKNVLEGGKDVFTSRVSVEGTMYYGYYIPVKQNNSDDIIGMIFAGMPVKGS